MPLIQEKLKSDIKALSKEMTNFEDQDEALDHYSSELAKIITEYIKSATVTVNPGIPIVGANAAGPVSGTTTGPGSGTLS